MFKELSPLEWKTYWGILKILAQGCQVFGKLAEQTTCVNNLRQELKEYKDNI